MEVSVLPAETPGKHESCSLHHGGTHSSHDSLAPVGVGGHSGSAVK